VAVPIDIWGCDIYVIFFVLLNNKATCEGLELVGSATIIFGIESLSITGSSGPECLPNTCSVCFECFWNLSAMST
jgi:hypothetical protein